MAFNDLTAAATTAWGTGKAKDANTTTGIADYVATAPLYNVSAQGLVFTASAGVFSTGVAKCTTYYFQMINIPAA